MCVRYRYADGLPGVIPNYVSENGLYTGPAKKWSMHLTVPSNFFFWYVTDPGNIPLEDIHDHAVPFMIAPFMMAPFVFVRCMIVLSMAVLFTIVPFIVVLFMIVMFIVHHRAV